MCYQVVEVHSACRCLYYRHAIERCAAFGQSDHLVEVRTLGVGYPCSQHAEPPRGGGRVYFNLTRHESDTASDAISTSSASTTLTIPDASGDDIIGKLFQDLLQDAELAHLLPQFVRHCRHLHVARKQLSRLLKRYSQDLASKATEKLHSQASRFVRSSRVNIAQRIAECYLHELQGNDGVVDVGEITETVEWTGPVAQPEEGDGASGDDEDDDNEAVKKGEGNLLVFYNDLTSFLFGGSPFEQFKGAVTDYVDRASCEGQSKHRLVNEAMNAFDFWTSPETIVCFFNVAMNLCVMTRPVLHPRKQTAWWTCACGRKLYDEYKELRPGAVADLQVYLASNSSSPCASSQAAATTTATTPGAASSSTRSPIHTLRNLWSTRAKVLPRQRQDIDTSECSVSNALPGNPSLHKFLLLCIPYMKWGLKVRQPDVCRLHSDRDFFKLLRHSYAQHRRDMRWSWLRTICRLDFVQFEMYHDDLVSIKCSPSMPSLASRHEYDYEMPDTDPPIGPNMAMHLLENPDHAHVLPILLRRIPIRRNRKLSPCPVKGVSIGWGVQFVEGVSPKAVFAFASVGFAICLVTSISWTVARKDVQGGFGIGAFILAFSIFCSAKLHLLIPYT